MDETKRNRAEELLEKAQQHLQRRAESVTSSGRQAIIGTGFALLGVRDELRGIRKALEKLAGPASKALELLANPSVKVSAAAVRETVSALASDLPAGCKISNCSSCHAPVIWIKTTSGKNMPLDAKPIKGSGFGISNGTASKAYPGPNYESHFATCPNADAHRKPRGTTQ